MKPPRAALALIALALALIAPAAHAPSASPPPPPVPAAKLQPPAQPMRALQVMNLDCTTPAELDLRLAGFKQAGAQAVILRVFHNPGDPYYAFIHPAAASGVYFKTAAAPVVGDVHSSACVKSERFPAR